MDERPEYRQLRRPWIRFALLAFLVIATCMFLAIQIRRLGLIKLAPHWSLDYQQYWGAARVLVAGGNPYDAATLARMEATTGIYTGVPIMMWNPPYTLVLALPFAALPFDLAALAWLATSALIAMTCGAALWQLLAPHGDRRYWLGMIVAIAYLPTLQALEMGQISPWLLVGITGFLLAVRAKQDFWAGAALTLLAIKPHVVYLLLAGVAWWMLRERRWKVLLGGVATLTAVCAVVGLISPAVFGQYLRAAASPPLYWRSSTLGTWLRTVFGSEQHWLQFMPSVVGFILFVGWALRRKGVWDWPRLAPGLLLASTICAAYGWGFDQVTLLPVVVVLFGSLRTMSMRQRVVLVGLYVLAQVGFLVQNQLGMDSAYYYGYPLVLAGLYAWQQRMTRLIPHQGTNEVTEREQAS